jgi:serine/threonine protein kinase/tetratricopeptide (TPR) repeat protein
MRLVADFLGLLAFRFKQGMRKIDMTSEHWELVTKIFDAALDQPESARNDFVRRECKGDTELAAEVLKLLVADGQAGSFLDRPAVATLPSRAELSRGYSLTAGNILSGRFEILRFIGQGGMGQVFEALDLELKARVALKAIRPDISSDPRTLSRFRREVQLTRRITHPNVCRTFDIERHSFTADDGTSSDIIFLTMELLEGETLAELLRRKGRLTVAEARPLVLQTIEALGAAHTAGIVHRDFKPSNVLLVPSNTPAKGSSISTLRVVVTDFGLARAVAADEQMSAEQATSSLTANQGMMGTLIYMAPEQFERGESSVATDIYSLGLVLFEMITGQRPFADDIPFAEAAKRLKQPALSAAGLVPDLDSTWDAAISRCLALEAKDRFANVRELADALTDTSAAVGTSVAATTANAPVTPAPAPSASTAKSLPLLLASRRKYFAIAGFTVLVMSLFALAFRFYWMKAEETKLAEGSTVLLTDVQNNTGDARFDSTTELVRSQLSQSPYFSLMDSDKIHKTLGEMLKPDNTSLVPQTAREVAMRNGVRRVVFGTVSRVGDSYVLDLDIEQPDNSPLRFRQHWQNHWTWSTPGSANAGNAAKDMPSGFLEAVRDSSDWIRHEIGESANDIAKLSAPPEDVTTASWEALSEFEQAEQFRAARDNESAVAALRKAVAADQNFALAYARLGDILVSLQHYRDGYAAYDKALALGQRRLTLRERYRISGIYALDTWNYAKAEDQFKDYARDFPHDYLSWFYFGSTQMTLGRVKDAIESLKKAAVIDPSKPSAIVHLAQCEMVSGDYTESAHWIAALRAHNLFDDATAMEGGLDFLSGKYQDAIDNFIKLRSAKDSLYRAVSYSLQARVLAELGQYRNAIEVLQDGAAVDERASDDEHRADKLLDIAYIKCRQRKYETCTQDVRLALGLDRSLEAIGKASAVLGEGAFDAKPTSRAAIVSVLREIEKSEPNSYYGPITDVVGAHVRGEMKLAEDNWKGALEDFDKAQKLEPKTRDRGYIARGFLVELRHTSDETATSSLRESAASAHATLAQTGGQVWQWAVDYLPGRWSDEILAYARLRGEKSKLGTDESALLRNFISRRAGGDRASFDTVIVEQLLGDKVRAVPSMEEKP